MATTPAVEERYIGSDLHKHFVVFCIIDAAGKVLQRHRCACRCEELERFGRRYFKPTDKLALEATTNTWEVVRILTPFVAEVVVSNPLKTRAIAEAKIKTDKVDALVLAQLLRCDFLPRVWEPPADTQHLRRLTARRAVLVMDATAIKNRLHAVLRQRLLHCPVADLFCKEGRRWLTTVEIDAEGRAALDSDLRLLAQVETELSQQDAVLAHAAYGDDRVKLLMTLPGVNYTVAQTVLAALGEISRFRDGAHAASYLGLVPRTHQSANHCYHGPITKQGNRQARALLVQAAQHVATHPGPLGAFFRRLARRKDRNIAVVATARKLVMIAWQLLTHNEPYRYAQPHTMDFKFTRLRSKVVGKRERRKVSNSLSPRRPLPQGQRLYQVPALATIYEEAGLPKPKPVARLPRGEQQMLEQGHFLDFVKEINAPYQKVWQRRVKKKSSKV